MNVRFNAFLVACLGLVTVGCDGRVAAQAPASVEAPAGTSFYGLTPQFAVSPDHRFVVFVATASRGQTRLYLKNLTSGTSAPMPGTDQASYPFWSPDSTVIGFFASGKLLKVPARFGADAQPVVICDAPTGRGGTWNADGVIVFTSGITDPLRKVSANGGQPEIATTLDAPREGSHRWPQFLPDGKHVLFWAGAGSAPAALKVVALDTKVTTTLVPADTNASYGGSRIYFGRAGALFSVAFDPATMKVSGEPVEVAKPLSADAGSSYASLSAASDGTLLYTEGEAKGFVLTMFNRDGTTRGVLPEPGQYTNVAIRNQCVAVSETRGTPANRDIWVLPLGLVQLFTRDRMPDGSVRYTDYIGRLAQTSCPPRRRVTTDATVDATPVWSPDGRSIVFSSTRSGPYQVYRVALDTPSNETLVFRSDVAAIATDVSRDGKLMAYTRGTAATGFDVWVVPADGSGQPSPAASGPGAEDSGVFSPDSRWLAYQSNESGRNEIYVKRLGGGSSAATRISAAGGTQPLWCADGRELYFLALDGAVTAATVDGTGETFAAEAPRKLFDVPLSLVIRRSYDVTPDGQQFLIPMLDDAVQQAITIAPPGTIRASSSPQ